MNRVAGKVALITGAGRGQGRSHAVRLAEEGADIIALDICAPVETAVHTLSTPDDLAETVKLVEKLDRRIVARQVDTRDLDGLEATVRAGLDEFGHLDIVIANAGIASFGAAWELSEHQWQEMIDVNLTGYWKTLKAAIPAMIEQGTGGSVILTSSAAGLAAFPHLAHYNAAKHGVTGLAKSFAIELAAHNIRVNSLHPTTVSADIIHNEAMYQLFTGISGATREQAANLMRGINAMDVPWIEPIDVSNAVLWLASDESRYVTGTAQVIDAGALAPFKIPHAEATA